MKRIVIAGEINVDLIFTGVPVLPQFGRETLAQTYLPCPGSSSMILAMGLARLGDPVRFVGRCGQRRRNGLRATLARKDVAVRENEQTAVKDLRLRPVIFCNWGRFAEGATQRRDQEFHLRH